MRPSHHTLIKIGATGIKMHEQEAKSFKKDGDFIFIYGDKEGSDLIIRLPVWMFNQMAETFFNVKIV